MAPFELPPWLAIGGGLELSLSVEGVVKVVVVVLGLIRLGTG